MLIICIHLHKMSILVSLFSIVYIGEGQGQFSSINMHLHLHPRGQAWLQEVCITEATKTAFNFCSYLHLSSRSAVDSGVVRQWFSSINISILHPSDQAWQQEVCITWASVLLLALELANSDMFPRVKRIHHDLLSTLDFSPETKIFQTQKISQKFWLQVSAVQGVVMYSQIF